jgi:hypothetical protein
MYIAKPTAETAKLRRNGMYSSQLNRQARFMPLLRSLDERLDRSLL